MKNIFSQLFLIKSIYKYSYVVLWLLGLGTEDGARWMDFRSSKHSARDSEPGGRSASKEKYLPAMRRLWRFGEVVLPVDRFKSACGRTGDGRTGTVGLRPPFLNLDLKF